MDGMDDLDPQGAETPERLSNSQLEAQRDSYDPDVHGGEGGVTEAEWNSLPGWRRGAIHKQAVRRREAEQKALRAEGAVEQMRRELAELKASVQNNQSKPAEPEPEGWAAVKTPKLEDYVRLADKTILALSLNPNDDALKEQAQRIDPDMLMQARRELAKRDAGGAVAEKEKSWNEQKSKEQAAAQMHGYLRNQYGDDVLNPKSELMRAAAQEYEQMADVGRIFGDATRVKEAIAAAHKRLHNTGRAISDNERARLQIEGGVRREASPFNEIDALRAKGDWKSKGQAVEKALDLALGQIYGE